MVWVSLSDINYLLLKTEVEHLRWGLSDIMSIGHTGNGHKGFICKIERIRNI